MYIAIKTTIAFHPVHDKEALEVFMRTVYTTEWSTKNTTNAIIFSKSEWYGIAEAEAEE